MVYFYELLKNYCVFVEFVERDFFRFEWIDVGFEEWSCNKRLFCLIVVGDMLGLILVYLCFGM